jgi:hypothetical protein
MTDSTSIYSLPEELINLIGQFLTPEELAQFRQICKLFYKVGAESSLLQPHYNRLRALDPSLPAQLPRQNAPQAFKEAFEKIRAAQLSEINYLSSHHDATQHPYLNRPLSPIISLEQLEERSAELDKINSDIIRPIIDTNLNQANNHILNLSDKGITRSPGSLIKIAAYAEFWKNLTELIFTDNQLTTLHLEDLTALQELTCDNNNLTSLILKGLTALEYLDCSENELTKLDLQDLKALKKLYCTDNEFTRLNLQGLKKLKNLNCGNNKLINLDLNGLTALKTLICLNNPLSSINIQALPALRSINFNNCKKLKKIFCDGDLKKIKVYPEKIINLLHFTKLSQPSKEEQATSQDFPSREYLPTFGSIIPEETQGLKRARDEEVEDKNDNESKEQKAPERKKPKR